MDWNRVVRYARNSERWRKGPIPNWNIFYTELIMREKAEGKAHRTKFMDNSK